VSDPPNSRRQPTLQFRWLKSMEDCKELPTSQLAVIHSSSHASRSAGLERAKAALSSRQESVMTS
jgi:hypothetical protein